MKKLFLILLFIVAISCTDESASERSLRAMGFSDIEFTGYALFGCDTEGDDVFRTGFQATGVNGTKVSGTVCCGWFKNCTVRVK